MTKEKRKVICLDCEYKSDTIQEFPICFNCKKRNVVNCDDKLDFQTEKKILDLNKTPTKIENELEIEEEIIEENFEELVEKPVEEIEEEVLKVDTEKGLYCCGKCDGNGIETLILHGQKYCTCCKERLVWN